MSRLRPWLVLAILTTVVGGCQLPGQLGSTPVEIRTARERFRAGDVSGAMAALDKAIASKPADPAVYIAAAQVSLEEGRPDRAVTLAERGLQASPGASAALHAQLHSLRGAALLELGDAAAAIPAYRAAARLMPEEPVFINNLAYALAEQAESDASLAEAERLAMEAVERAVAAQAEPRVLGVFLDTLGWVQLRRGDLRRASLNLTEAAELAPDEAEVSFHLAQVRLAEGRRADARVLLQRALKLKPGLTRARRLLEELSAEDASRVGPAPLQAIREGGRSGR